MPFLLFLSFILVPEFFLWTSNVYICYFSFIQVCDFGLSRLKHNTFLSSKSTAGTVRIRKIMCYSGAHLFSHMQYVSYLPFV